MLVYHQGKPDGSWSRLFCANDVPSYLPKIFSDQGFFPWKSLSALEDFIPVYRSHHPKVMVMRDQLGVSLWGRLHCTLSTSLYCKSSWVCNFGKFYLSLFVELANRIFSQFIKTWSKVTLCGRGRGTLGFLFQSQINPRNKENFNQINRQNFAVVGNSQQPCCLKLNFACMKCKLEFGDNSQFKWYHGSATMILNLTVFL